LAKYRPVWRAFGVLNSDQTRKAARNRASKVVDTENLFRYFFDLRLDLSTFHAPE